MPLDQQGFQIEPITRADEVLDVLVKARALISNERNWCCNGAGDGDLTFCTAVAVRTQAGVQMKNGWFFSKASSPEMRRWNDATEYLIRELPKNWERSLPCWNDDDTTTHADVLGLFDRAIAKRVADAKATP